MKRKNTLPLLLIGLALGLGLVVFMMIRSLAEPAMKACILSLEAQLSELLNESKHEIADSLTIEWTGLSRENSRDLISRLGIAGKTDCGTISNIKDGNDIWGNAIRILIRKKSEPKIDVKVWSLGPDGRENTADDIVVENR